MALGAIVEFRAAGLRIPQDLSIIGFDDISFATISEPQLTTVCLPRKDLGGRSVEALLETIENPDQKEREILHDPSLGSRFDRAGRFHLAA